MRFLMDENVHPAHISAVESVDHDVRRVEEVLRKGASDQEVLEAARNTDRIVLTYDRKDFSTVTDHSGVFIADERMEPHEVRRAISDVNRAYPTLDNVVEFLTDWV